MVNCLVSHSGWETASLVNGRIKGILDECVWLVLERWVCSGLTTSSWHSKSDKSAETCRGKNRLWG